MEASNKRSTRITVAVLVALALIVAGAMAVGRQGGGNDTAGTSRPAGDGASQAGTTANTSTTGAAYKDGTYRATGGYSTPGGRESVDVSLTLKDGTVTESTAKGTAESGRAARYQRDFESNYRQEVVGKKLSDIRLQRVSGSSLTSAGFNDALSQIARQARP